MNRHCSVPHDIDKSYGYYYRQLNYIHNSFSNVNENYLGEVLKIEDPILQLISLDMIEYYIELKRLAPDCSIGNPACDALNWWLNQRKYFFSFAENCEKKKQLWEDKIEQLWKKLEADSKYGSWCKRQKYTFTTTFPEEMKSIKCNDIQNENKSSICPEQPCPLCPELDCTNCSKLICPDCHKESCTPCPPQVECSSNISSETQLERIQLPSKDSLTQFFSDSVSSQVILIMGGTLLGVLFILFLLYKFTPLVSWLYSRQRKTIKLRRQVNEELENAFLDNSYENTDEDSGDMGNNIFYTTRQY
ncbi:PIR Superfamily Protein [Plasmodium ovale curtisi]|uniref:PIR Superfamily Protein n=1 Tax=Plasmodium ovale curtisi TaxID=864141 RepID=A0A1A8VPL0_PLAOA|nr:PIR Superfamily Protein [Plasmodium ovale curtisi]